MNTTIKLPKQAVIPEGYNWTIEEHDEVITFDPSKLSLHLEPEQEKSYLEGVTMRERMKGKGLNSNVLDYLLKNPKLIPEDWKGKYVYFWGTIFRGADGGLRVRCLCWDDGLWVWHYDWLDGHWHSGNPTAVSASPLNLDTDNSSDTLTLDLKSAIEICKKNGLKVIKEY